MGNYGKSTSAFVQLPIMRKEVNQKTTDCETMIIIISAFHIPSLSTVYSKPYSHNLLAMQMGTLDGAHK